MPLLKRKRVLAASIEATSGTIETLDATDAVINAFDVMPQATIEFIQRPSQGSFSQLPGTLGAYGGTISFKTEIYGDGAGGVPAWASTFLPACGWVNSTGTFSPATEAPGSNVKTVTIGVYEDGKLKRLRGAVGSFKLIFATGKVAMIEWNFTGVWQAPTDATLLTPTYPTDLPIRFANSTFTLGGSSPGCVETIEIDAGNSLALRPCPGNSDGSGYSAGIVLDRRVVGSMNPESQLVASNDHFGKWLSGTEEALSIALADASDTITIAAPKVQRTNIQEADRGGLQTDQIEFQCNKSAAAGNDELTITFAATV